MNTPGGLHEAKLTEQDSGCEESPAGNGLLAGHFGNAEVNKELASWLEKNERGNLTWWKGRK
jgi:hypothetical protein